MSQPSPALPPSIIVDLMGSDKGPEELIKGVISAAKAYPNVRFLLCGDEKIIQQQLSQSENKNPSQFEILHAPQVITFNDQPTTAIKDKKESSMVVGLKALKAGQGQAFVSAGSTGALLVGVFRFIKRRPGISRPALCALLPTATGHTLLLDCGANAEVKPNYLLEFGQLGAEYIQRTMGVTSPKVGLVNVGTEKEKGTPILQEAHQLLEDSALNFVGNIEGKDIPAGTVDVAVCDGYVGNVILKLTEGLSKTLMGMIKEELLSSFISKLGAVLSAGAFKNLKKRFDYREVGGAPFLGLESLVVKAHGSSDALAIQSAIGQCIRFLDHQ